MWGLDRSLLRIQVIENKKCSPEKVRIIWHLQIDIVPTQKLDFIQRELSYEKGYWPSPYLQKAYDLYSALLTECHVLDRYEIKKEDAVLKQTHVHSTLLGLWLSRGL